MSRSLHPRSFRGTLRQGVVLCSLIGCSTARPAPVSARLVAPAQWPGVVDCVVLAARASELFAEADSAGITITPGLTPLAQQRAAGRAGVVGTVRVVQVRATDGLHVTMEPLNWDPPAAGRAGAKRPGAARSVARQLDAQCLADFPSVAGG